MSDPVEDEPVDPDDRAPYMDIVSRWADDLAHEIKNPLNAMVINLELVKRRAQGGDPKAAIERTEVVEAELHRVHDLVDSLLRLVRPWPRTDSAAVDGVLDALLPAFVARAGIRRIEYTHSLAGASAAIAPVDLAQAIVTVMDRAIERTPDGGRLATGVHPADATVRVTVVHTATPAATGPAGDESADPRLAAARRRVEAVGGSIAVEASEDEERTTLTLRRSGTR